MKNKYLDKKITNLTLVQVMVEEDLKKKIEVILKKEHWTLRHLITGLLRKFLDEYRVK